MRDLQAVINAAQNDAALAANGLADAVDILAILDMALDSRMEEGAPFTQICTVLNKALESARTAQEAAQRVSTALTKELRF